MVGFITDNLVQTLGEGTVVNNDLITSINLSVSEMGVLFGEQLPNNIIVAEIVGYQWNNNFIDKMLYTMASDNVGILNEKELEAWNNFILFEDGNVTQTELYETLDKRVMDIYNGLDKVTTKVLYGDLYEINY